VAGLEGATIGPYEIKALLGAGGMGQVYRAHDPRLEREVAIKVLSAALAHEPGYLERFRREARAVAKLNHPNVVQVYDFGEQGDLTYLVMPLISGGTLREYLAHRQVLPLAEALSIIEQVASALQYAHERGLVHRDVKPANILMTSEGRALLSDFGIVRLVQKDDNATTLTHMGAFVGSPEYAAPEMIVGKPVDRRVDVYALGVILFQMLTGRLPFAGATPVALMMMQAQQPPPAPRSLNPDISPAVEAVILKALAKEPGERYQTAAELLTALRAAITGPSAGAGYTLAPLPGGINNLPTILSPSVPPAPGSGLAAYSPPGPGSVTPSVWVGPSSGPADWANQGSGPAGWATPASGPAGWANQGSGPSAWAASGSGPAAAPPLAPTFATGISALPNQPPVAPRPSTLSRHRWLLILSALALALIVGGGSVGALSLLSSKASTPPLGATSTSQAPTATTTSTPTPTSTPLPAGTITEFTIPTSDSAPWGITAGPDGSLWFTEEKSNKIGRITPQGSFREFTIPTSGSHPLDIAAGPDGNLWFTEQKSNKIGRVTPQGSFREFPVPTQNSQPYGIVAGPDDNIWFAERIGKIGRITPQGTFKEFPVSTQSSDPLELTTGPDGNIWFTEYAGNQIGRITPQGAITEFPVPAPNSKPWGIVTGPDGNLWFTEYGSDQIGRVTPQGSFREFPVPTPNGQPVGITVGPDRNLWFTEFANKIARITPQGDLTEFSMRTAANFPVGITTGPDRNLWFTEDHASKIGRIATGR
jgi:serine/threonine protein kinase